MKRAKTLEEAAEYLLENAIKVNGCLIAHLKPQKRGYVYIAADKEQWRAHRLIYDFLVGGLQSSDLVLHKCDNRACINIDHLYVGTAAQNTADMLERNRAANQHGKGFGISYTNRRFRHH